MRIISFLLVLALLDGCVSTPYRTCPRGVMVCRESAKGSDRSGGLGSAWGYGGSGSTEPPREVWGESIRAAPPWANPDSEARKDEVEYASDGMWGLASTIDGEGAIARFAFWSNGGALTPVEVELFPPVRQSSGSGESSFRAELQSKLDLFAGPQPRYIQLTFQHGHTGWRLSSFSSRDAPRAPPEGRTLPVRQPHVPEEQRREVERLLAALMANARAPGAPGAEWRLQVKLVDDRVQGLSTLRHEPKGKPSSEATEPTLPWKMTNAILPFLAGVGERDVQLLLRAEAEPDRSRLEWRIAWAATEHPQVPELAEFGTSYAEYRLLEEGILRQWREQTREYAQTAALFTAREVAIWFIGGWALHGLGAMVEFATSPLWRIVTRLGPSAVGWLECLLIRIPEAEREPLLKLCAKMEKEGARALSAREKNELYALLDRYIEIAAKPLGNAEKDELRKIARQRFWQIFHPELVDTLVDVGGNLYEVHHLTPLEYAHLFVEMDINAVENLVAMEADVHISIGKIWTAFRPKRAVAKASDVQKVVEIINRRYKHWYNTVYNQATEAAQLQAAEAAAKAEVQNLLKSMATP